MNKMDPKTVKVLQKLGSDKIDLSSVRMLEKQMDIIRDAIRTTKRNTEELKRKIEQARNAKSLYNKTGTPGHLESTIKEIKKIVKDLGVQEPPGIPEAERLVREFNSVIEEYSNIK